MPEIDEVPFGHMGYKFEMIGRGTGGDIHLTVVLGRSRDNDPDNRKWIVWYYNHQTNGFFDGHYTNVYDSAQEEFWKRAGRIRQSEHS